MSWLEREYDKCRLFCTKYQDYKRITNLGGPVNSVRGRPGDPHIYE